MSIRALVVDDEKAIRNLLKTALTPHGYQIFEAASGAEAVEKSVSCHPDVIILDLGLPDMDGMDVGAAVRKRSRTPIIILSIREDKSDKISALDLGADDYVTKPFDHGELLARLNSVMRRLTPAKENTLLQAGPLAVDLSRHAVTLNGRPLKLSPTEYDVLKTLVMNPDKILTRRQMLEEVWNRPDDKKASHLLTVTINNLREKIEPRPDAPTCILTEVGVGYRFRPSK
jgi:two-component system KDP operon response regulator KdpE